MSANRCDSLGDCEIRLFCCSMSPETFAARLSELYRRLFCEVKFCNENQLCRVQLILLTIDFCSISKFESSGRLKDSVTVELFESGSAS